MKLNFGAIGLFHTDKPVIEALSEDIKKTLLNYESFITDILHYI